MVRAHAAGRPAAETDLGARSPLAGFQVLSGGTAPLKDRSTIVMQDMPLLFVLPLQTTLPAGEKPPVTKVDHVREVRPPVLRPSAVARLQTRSCAGHQALSSAELRAGATSEEIVKYICSRWDWDVGAQSDGSPGRCVTDIFSTRARRPR